MDAIDAAGLSAWTPIRVRTSGGEPAIDWAVVDEAFSDPFFEQTVGYAMEHPFNAAFARRTTAGVLQPPAEHAPGLMPTGFIFHMSRCGSTLISQMLAALPSAIVLSEAQPLDGLIRLRRTSELGEQTLIGWLRAMMSALGRARRGERYLFVKFHAAHVLELPLLARAFPDVPWIFVYREPRGVLRSQARIPGAETVPGTIDPVHLGIDAAAATAMPQDEYVARTVAAFCEAALAHAARARAAFVDYAGLPGAVFSEVLEFFGVELGDGDEERMRAVALRDTKRTGGPFRPQAEEAAPEIGELAARWLDDPYAALRARSR